MSFAPLFSDIVDSSIWGETKETRLVWITLLAKKDCMGVVQASVPGLARAAVVTLEECREALRVLMSPDPESRSKEHEGRRIEEVSGGWCVLNHFAYRDKMSVQSRKDYQREYQRYYRRHRRELREVGARDGATQAVVEGLREAGRAGDHANGHSDGVNLHGDNATAAASAATAQPITK